MSLTSRTFSSAFSSHLGIRIPQCHHFSTISSHLARDPFAPVLKRNQKEWSGQRGDRSQGDEALTTKRIMEGIMGTGKDSPRLRPRKPHEMNSSKFRIGRAAGKRRFDDEDSSSQQYKRRTFDKNFNATARKRRDNRTSQDNEDGNDEAPRKRYFSETRGGASAGNRVRRDKNAPQLKGEELEEMRAVRALSKTHAKDIIYYAQMHNFDKVQKHYLELKELVGEDELLRNEDVSNAIIVALIETHRMGEAKTWLSWLYKMRSRLAATYEEATKQREERAAEKKRQEEEGTAESSENTTPPPPQETPGFFYPYKSIVMRTFFEQFVRMGDLTQAEHHLYLLFDNHPAEKSNTDVLNMWLKALIKDAGDKEAAMRFFERRYYGVDDPLPWVVEKSLNEEKGLKDDSLEIEDILQRDKEANEEPAERRKVVKKKSQKGVPNAKTLALLLRFEKSPEMLQKVLAMAQRFHVDLTAGIIEQAQDIEGHEEVLAAWPKRVERRRQELEDEDEDNEEREQV